ncbi:MAG: sulfite exporter TauE/SafE family protein [Gallionellaceae bacterium]|jgi:uncharacterized membrane protein YfcA|nr:sulfite exporter TauE/SafE family protein [Gallionellaceae bacterium]
MLEPVQYLLGIGSGALVGFVLSLIGGGGSILAVPLMVYLVGVSNPHVAIGTSALAVAANALIGLINPLRQRTVKWRCAIVFAASGLAGAFAGSSAGKAIDGHKLLFLFALVMIIVGALMLRNRHEHGDDSVVLGRGNAPKLMGYGIGSGLFSGFFGVGGGFLIVPGLIAATGMPITYAIGSSLIAVSAFGLTTAANYAVAGLIDWPLAVVFIAGGALGSFLGARVSKRLSGAQARLTTLFAGLIFVVALYMIWQSIRRLG